MWKLRGGTAHRSRTFPEAKSRVRLTFEPCGCANLVKPPAHFSLFSCGFPVVRSGRVYGQHYHYCVDGLRVCSMWLVCPGRRTLILRILITLTGLAGAPSKPRSIEFSPTRFRSGEVIEAGTNATEVISPDLGFQASASSKA